MQQFNHPHPDGGHQEPQKAELDAIQQNFVSGLREMADWYEAHPNIPTPKDFSVYEFKSENKAAAQKVARALGTFDKKLDDTFLKLQRDFGGISLRFVFYRKLVCQRRVVGTKTVTERVPDPEAAPPPMVEVTKEREIVEWDCPPLLAPELEAA